MPIPRRAGPWACLFLLAGAAQARADAAGAATEALRPSVRTLAREVDTYHYAYRPAAHLPAAGPIPEGGAIAEAYLRRRVARYFDLSAPTAPYGMVSGLYVAIDPVIGRTFGGIGDAWALFVVPLARGFRFLDARAGTDPRAPRRLPEALRRDLTREGCEATTPAALLTGIESRACRRVAVHVVEALDVDGILYPYQGIPFEACPRRQTGAFIVLRPTRLGPARLLTRELPPVPGEDHRTVHALFQLARRAGSLQPEPWPELDGEAAPPGLLEFMRERLFGCGPWPEDQPPDDAPRGAEGSPWKRDDAITPVESTPRRRR